MDVMDIDERFEQVCDPESFLGFVRALIADRLEHVKHPIEPDGRGGTGWESETIEDFLKAAVARAVDSRSFGKRQDENEASLWKAFAGFLYAGKTYE